VIKRFFITLLVIAVAWWFLDATLTAIEFTLRESFSWMVP
jgi:hypothetical protein